MPGFDMKDYVPVNERIDQFYQSFPHGSLQSEIVELTEKRVTIRASAYRTPDDPRPGTGHSSLDIPGSTPYTRGSEIENAETSAWGRAIAALGFEVKRGVASAEEVRNKTPKAQPSKRDELLRIAQEHRLSHTDLERMADEAGVQPGQKATEAQYAAIIQRITEQEQPALNPDAQEASSAPAAPSPTLDDILEATGGELVIEQPEAGASPPTSPLADNPLDERIQRARARAGSA